MKWTWRGRSRRNAELEEELRAHLLLAEREGREMGHAADEARAEARREFGNVAVAEETTRDMWGWRWAYDLVQDTRYALRALRQNPGFAAVAILTLALGTGATTIMFSVVHGVLLKPLPFPDAAKLLAIHGHSNTWNTAAFGEQNLSYPDFLDLQAHCKSIELAGQLYNGATLSAPGNPQYLDLREISANLFSVLGVRLARGREFTAEEDRLGGAPVAILGYSFWGQHFGGSEGVVGSTVVVDAKAYVVVGVAPQGLRLPDDEPDLFTPVGQDTAKYVQLRAVHPFRGIARLRGSGTLGQAQNELAVVGHEVAAQFPDTNGDRTFVAQRLHPDVGDVSATIWLLLGAVTLVLLVACANVASLLLARAVSREREFAMRVALGAGRGRLARQCLTESAVLALAAGAIGIAIAGLGLRPFIEFWPGNLPRAQEVRLDWPVLAFALAASVFSGLLFGLAPALRAPVGNLDRVLRASTRTILGGSRRLHGSFVVCELALAVVLLVSAGMLGRTLLHLSSLEPGLSIQNVLVTRVALSPNTLKDAGRSRTAWNEIVDRARRIPGIQSAATVDTVPMRQGNNQIGYWTSAAIPPENQLPLTLATSVSPSYLDVMGIRLRQGRFFDDHDRLGSPLVVVIDDVLAQQAFGTVDAAGKQLWIPNIGDGPITVIGVVGHVRHWGFAGDDRAQVRAQLYYPFAQVPDNLVRRWSELTSLVVRTTVDPLSIVEPLRRELRGSAGDQVLYEVHTMEQLARGTLAQQRFLLLLFTVFAGMALLLVCIGIYGVLAYLTRQRVPEIGIRMAIGATQRSVLWLILRQSLTMIIVGIGVGIAAALAASRILLRFVEGMQPTVASSLAITIPVLVAAALFASFLPAHRASQVDPLVALRHD